MGEGVRGGGGTTTGRGGLSVGGFGAEVAHFFFFLLLLLLLGLGWVWVWGFRGGEVGWKILRLDLSVEVLFGWVGGGKGDGDGDFAVEEKEEEGWWPSGMHNDDGWRGMGNEEGT